MSQAEPHGAMSLTSQVSDIRELARVNGSQVWLIALEHTPFLPGMRGSLTATARSGASIHIPVLEVQLDESGAVWHRTAKPLPVGTEVTCTFYPSQVVPDR